MSYLQQVQFNVEPKLPEDNFFFSHFYSAALDDSEFTSVDVEQCTKLIFSLFEGSISLRDYDAKHFHTLTVLCAAWLKKDSLVSELIERSPYDKQELKHLSAIILVYRRKWTSLESIQEKIGKPLNSKTLWEISYSAGAGANFDLICELRNYDAYLLNHVYEGIDEHRYFEDKQKLQKMCVPVCKRFRGITKSERSLTFPLICLLVILLVLLCIK